MTEIKKLNAAEMLHIIMRELADDSEHLMLLMDMIYLCDWRSALVHDQQLTDIVWHNYYKGPRWQNLFESRSDGRIYSAVPQCVIDDSMLSLDIVIDPSGDPKPFIVHKNLDSVERMLGISDARIDNVLRYVYQVEQDVSRLGVAEIALSTYPVMTSNLNEPLDLVRKAIQFRERFGHIDDFSNHYR